MNAVGNAFVCVCLSDLCSCSNFRKPWPGKFIFVTEVHIFRITIGQIYHRVCVHAYALVSGFVFFYGSVCLSLFSVSFMDLSGPRQIKMEDRFVYQDCRGQRRKQDKKDVSKN